MPEKTSARYRSLIVTSCKGGIGKSTVCANLAASLAALGHRVLVIDCDFSNRSLDLIFNCEENLVYDITDLVHGRATAEQTVIALPGRENIWFIPAPMVCRELFSSEQLKAAVDSAAHAFDCNTVLIDSPGAADWILPVIAPVTEAALIVVSHMPTSVRGAEKTGYSLESIGVKEQYLIINRFDAKKVRKNERPGLNELIDRTHIPILGVIPESRALELGQEKGRLACQLGRQGRTVSAAFEETAKRICGERIPVMSYLSEKKRRELLNS